MPGGAREHAVLSLLSLSPAGDKITELVLLWVRALAPSPSTIREFLVVSDLSPSPALHLYGCTSLALKKSRS